MGTTLQDASEIVSGLVLTSKLSPNSVRTEILFPPYSDVIKSYKAGIIEPEELIMKHGLGPVQSCLEAVKSLNGLSGADWLNILETTYMKHTLGSRMKKLGEKLERGDDVDPVEVRHLANQFGKGKTGRFSLADGETEEVPFIETGLSFWDKHFGGTPKAGLIVIAGDSGVGKTTMLRDSAKAFIRKYKKKKVGIYSLEMFEEEIIGKFNESGRMNDDEASRIEINCDAMKIDEIFADAASIENLGKIQIDFADMLIQGEATTGKYSEIYLACHYGAKHLGVPVELYAQFIKSYQGGIPRPHHIAWTNMAKILAWELIMLYRPAEDYYAEKDANLLPVISDIGYVIGWKIRGGFRNHREDSPGAIQLPFDGVKGWGVLPDGRTTSGKWFSLKNA